MRVGVKHAENVPEGNIVKDYGLRKVLMQETRIKDRRDEKELSLIWDEKCIRYERDKEEQYRGLGAKIAK